MGLRSLAVFVFVCVLGSSLSFSQTENSEANAGPGKAGKAGKPGGGKGKRAAKKAALKAQNGVIPDEAPPIPVAAALAATTTVTAGTSLPPAEQTGEGDLNPRVARRRAANARVNSEPPTPLYQVNATKLTSGNDYDTQPSITQTSDGDTYLAFVRYSPDKQDEVIAMLVRGGVPMRRLVNWKVVSGKPGQFIRPVIAAAGTDVYCLWTKTQELELASIWYSKLSNGKWGDPQRLLPNEALAHQNPEVCADKDGHVAVVYQVNDGNGYKIACTMMNGGNWSAPVDISGAVSDTWDPTCTFDTNGRLHIAWSTFDHGDYDVYVSRIDTVGASSATAPKRLSARGMYDMHPWLSASPDGSVWLSWDSVYVRRHGYSGQSTITGANLKNDTTTGAQPEHGFAAERSGIEVRVLDGDTVRVPGNPHDEIIAPVGYKIAHRAMGKVCVGKDGVPWIVYRALTQPSPAWGEPGSNAGYYWALEARPFRNGKWQQAVDFIESDGYLEEAGVYAAKDGVKVAYTSEHRRSQTSNIDFLVRKDGVRAPSTGTSATINEVYDHHHDFDNFLGWDGDIYMAQLGTGNDKEAAPAVSSLTTEDKPVDRPVDTRLTRETGRYNVTANGQNYNLYWGDTHRHSNVSRCSVGNEPSPDDLYRYGIDINLYDYVALSDHAEHTTDYYWWKQQKTADLYNIPGVLSVLYNYEWSMSFPEGHHNAIFPTRNDIKINGKLGTAKTAAGGWEILAAGGYKAITAPHTTGDPGMGTTWPSNNDQFQRVCEIFQACRGSYEYDGCPRQPPTARNKAGFYWKGLEKGYHMGIICSSDHGMGCAYACTYATTDTRDAVWQSIWDRRCYGSTTYGLVADVRSGDHWMGEQWNASEAPPISIYVRGSAPIRSVDIMGRFKVLHSEGSLDQPLNQKEFKLTWTDPDWSTLSGENWYYVRIIQTDDEMAWTSPMWVTKQ